MDILTDNQIKDFNENGYLVIDDFISAEKCDQMINGINDLIQNHDFKDFNHVFTSKPKGVTDELMHDAYFLNSWNKVHYFMERDQPKQDGDNPKPILNKIGHNLHNEIGIFKDISFDKRFKSICGQLGFEKPAICQSMYIFKHAKYGAAVPPHQDASFLWTDPECRILGFWIPLRDVTLENGCLWAVPGSHKTGLLNDVRFVRAPEIGEYATKLTADYPEFPHSDYKPLLLKRGGLVLIHGYVLHKSLPNTSEHGRDVFTWHIVDASHGTSWNQNNWINPDNGIDDFTAC